MMLACGVHLGSENLNAANSRYVYKRNDQGIHIIDLRKTWEKLQLAARVLVAVENPKDITAVALTTSGSLPIAQRALLKFSRYLGTRNIAGRFTPGSFTNQHQPVFTEPRVLLVTDPIKDHQPITEASYMNIPVIAFANTNADLRGVDIAIPVNTEGKFSVALMYYLLAREVLRLRDSISRDAPWEVMVDMFIYRDPEEAEKQEQAQRAAEAAAEDAEEGVVDENWDQDAGNGDWAGEAGQEWTSESGNWGDEGAPAAAGEGAAGW